MVVGVLLVVADAELLEPSGYPTEHSPKVVDREGEEDLRCQGPDLLDHVVVRRHCATNTPTAQGEEMRGQSKINPTKLLSFSLSEIKIQSTTRKTETSITNLTRTTDKRPTTTSCM